MKLSLLIMSKQNNIDSILALLKPKFPFDYLDNDTISMDDYIITNNLDSFVSISNASLETINYFENDQKKIISEIIGDANFFLVQFMNFEILKNVLRTLNECKILIDNEYGNLYSLDQVLNFENYEDYIGGPHTYDYI